MDPTHFLPPLAFDDVVGDGILLYGEYLCPAELDIPTTSHPDPSYVEPADKFAIERVDDVGSYGMVYLHNRRRKEYGQAFSIEVYSKRILGEEGIEGRLLEASIRMTLPKHRNILTLHRVLETSVALVFIQDLIPATDLATFLKTKQTNKDFPSDSTYSQDVRFSPARTRLAVSLFTQMCDAVAACHSVSVYHRNLQPKNFLIEDRRTTVSTHRTSLAEIWLILASVCHKFALLSLSDNPSARRNRRSSTHRSREADLWALGVLLIKLLYHCEPWKDTGIDECPDFASFASTPLSFMLKEFPQLPRPMSALLVDRVFRIHEAPAEGSFPIDPQELGRLIKGFIEEVVAPPAPNPQGAASPRQRHDFTSRNFPKLDGPPSLPPIDPSLSSGGLFDSLMPIFEDMQTPWSPTSTDSTSQTDKEASKSEHLASRTAELKLSREQAIGDVIPRGRWLSRASLVPSSGPPRDVAYTEETRQQLDVFAARSNGNARDPSPTSLMTVRSIAKSVLSQASKKSNKNFYQVPPGRPLLR
ncbi:kinase-like protein [Artomyces pyxidatus]|uniref:Kinase-like protein n=1 Tax=Artomyces pyxidatus TaxID=48021 RepID=A0ACB8T0C9_9AGAM|nr:kinase-like protein [Artomyces pyxidatus]